jgi:signal transduction histidine kinase
MPFYRTEPSRNRQTGGAGLGLSIAKEIVAGQNGELALKPREERGLAAVISLPAV